jgi:thiamine-monophosphate kinase
MARMKSEFELIDALARASRSSRGRTSGVVVGIGDDAAVLRVAPRDDLVATTDAMVEGRHFERTWLSPRDLGWRLAAANLSDIAAMGAQPRWALISLVMPRSVSALYAQAIQRGAAQHLARYGASIVGGNVASTDGPLVCDMTLFATVARGKEWRRRARAGDAIVVAGTLGASGAGVASLRRGDAASLVRAYRRPTPRIDVARALAGNAAVHGAIDVSDGLSSDIVHMCEASNVGCELDAALLPVPRGVRMFCASRRHDVTEWALAAGEDYALLLSVAPKQAGKICRTLRGRGIPAVVVGIFTANRGEYGILERGRVRAFRPRGWDHLKA